MNGITAPPLPPGVTVGPMRDDELAIVKEWVAAEGWNPGVGDLDVARAVDPAAFVALRRGDELIGSGTVLSYDGRFGFMGVFVVRPDARGHRLGAALWWRRLALMIDRLGRGASIGMDGVFDLVPFYEKGGFVTAYRDLRYVGTTTGERDPEALALADIGFDAIDTYDRRHVPAPRTAFLRAWLSRPDSTFAALVDDRGVVGYGMARPSADGVRVGPLFADDAGVAERIFSSLAAGASGKEIAIDVPEANPAAVALAERAGMQVTFGCARMYRGPQPEVPLDHIFGVTSFEFG